jgi:hypothetical protein
VQGVLLIKEGVIGNNVTTGPSQHPCWRGCLTGTALDKFNEFTLAVGNETAANLVQVERGFVTFFAPGEVLRQQTRCIIRFCMRKPKEVSARQDVGAVATLNNTLAKLPPAFEDLQKVSDMDMMDILTSKIMITEIYFTLSRSPRTNSQEKSTHTGGITSRVAMRPLEVRRHK